MIRNLLSNALKFTDQGGSVWVTLSVENSSIEADDPADGGEDIEMMRSSTSKRTSTTTTCLSKVFSRRQSEVYAESSHFVIAVKDSGVGISKVR